MSLGNNVPCKLKPSMYSVPTEETGRGYMRNCQSLAVQGSSLESTGLHPCQLPTCSSIFLFCLLHSLCYCRVRCLAPVSVLLPRAFPGALGKA